MPSDLTGTVTHSHDPKPPELPPLPEAILLRASPGFDGWDIVTVDDREAVASDAKVEEACGFATRIVTIQPPPSAREVSDAEVAKIIRDAGVAYPNWTDSEMLRNFDVTAKCVRAALKGAAHAK